MVDKHGNAYLIDFGASKQIRANGSMTTSTALCYTPGYAPNEQIGQMYDRFGPWTDIYALGATIYNLLTNKKPPMAIDIEEDEEDAFDFPNTVSDGMRKLVVWMMQPKRKARPQSVEEVIEMIEKQPQEEAPNPVSKVKPVLEPEPENEETLLIGQSDSNNSEKTANQSQNTDEEPTILVVSKKNQKPAPHIVSNNFLPQRAVKVGDYIFDDGSYSDKMEEGRTPLGVLFSYYGGAHGQILSAVKPDENMSINGKELKWHEASVAEWVEVIQNLCHCKVNFSSWNYRFYSDRVKWILASYQIKEKLYATKKSVNGMAYEVNIEMSKITPIDYDNDSLPYIFISEF
jgi:serine/threonine protein kinase